MRQGGACLAVPVPVPVAVAVAVLGAAYARAYMVLHLAVRVKARPQQLTHRLPFNGLVDHMGRIIHLKDEICETHTCQDSPGQKKRRRQASNARTKNTRRSCWGALSKIIPATRSIAVFRRRGGDEAMT